jgi:transcription elongation GreA/GreB family factor
MHFVTNEDQMSGKREDLYIVQANHRRATGDKSKNKEKAVAEEARDQQKRRIGMRMSP